MILGPQLCTRIWVCDMIGLLKKPVVKFFIRMKGNSLNHTYSYDYLFHVLGEQNKDISAALQG